MVLELVPGELDVTQGEIILGIRKVAKYYIGRHFS